MFEILYVVYLIHFFLHSNTVETSPQGLQNLSELVLNFTKCIVADEICPNPEIKFFLYNRKIVATEGSYEISPGSMDSIKSAPFINNDKLIVLFHGYTGHKDYSPNMELRPAFLDHKDTNIISVDWSPLARAPCYVQAAVNTDVVGMCVAKFLISLFTLRPDVVSCNNTHVIGFSLGAHCAGDTGKYLQELGCKLTWITGLDPALPLFSEIGAKREWTLDQTDAEFVDVIHTNVGWKGQFGPEGHVDFYITNGYAQPGCLANSSCDHVRAVEIYSESISTNTGFYGAPCGLYIKSFLFGFVHQVCMMTSNDESKYILVGLQVPHDNFTSLWEKRNTAAEAIRALCETEGGHVHQRTAWRWFQIFNGGERTLERKTGSGQPSRDIEETLLEAIKSKAKDNNI